jgi:hypothetical protein
MVGPFVSIRVKRQWEVRSMTALEATASGVRVLLTSRVVA